MEDDSSFEIQELTQRLQRHRIGFGILGVLLLVLALWNASLLSGAVRARRGVIQLSSAIDSLRAAQSEQLQREQLAAVKLARLDVLETELEGKASVRGFARLSRRVGSLARTTARIDSALSRPDTTATNR